MTAVQEPRMRVELPARDLTLDDVTELAAADDVHRYELDEGKLVIMPPADAVHSDLIMRVGAWLIANGYGGRVLATPGLRITERSAGRVPDILVLNRPPPEGTVWVDPADALLAVEIVSPGSEVLDRVVKPGEYARAGVPHYWRIERDIGARSVHLYTLGQGEQGEPAYLGHTAVLLDKLLAGEPPRL